MQRRAEPASLPLRLDTHQRQVVVRLGGMLGLEHGECAQDPEEAADRRNLAIEGRTRSSSSRNADLPLPGQLPDDRTGHIQVV